MTIHVLDKYIAAQIAAGEVVERPASVVKELLENAIDAGATRINIEASGGGIREIVVRDNGTGIAAAEVELAFERHATSKLRTPDDLWSIGTLGFRGEALPSIASVSQVICITRTADEEVGTELRIAGGELQARSARGCSPGTSISVRNLFYNTPVRRDYLRSDSNEMSAITGVVQQYAMAYPDVRFTLVLDGRLILQTTGNDQLQDVLIEIYGVDVARQMLPVHATLGEGADAIAIYGAISPPGLTRTSRGALSFFVNRRAVSARGTFAAVVQDAYHTLLMKGRFPMVVLNIGVPANSVDVNVHPAKREVRFRHQTRVMALLGRAVREALATHAEVQPWNDAATGSGAVAESGTVAESETAQAPTNIQAAAPSDTPAAPMTRAKPAPKPPHPRGWKVAASAWRTEQSRWDVGGVRPRPVYAGPVPLDSPAPPEDAAPDAAAPDESSGEEEAVGRPAMPPLRVVGQVGLTYIVAESPGGMYLIDQHAAHERITYERLMGQHAENGIESQQLLMPQGIALPPDVMQLLLGHREQLTQWGFVIDMAQDGMLQVHAHPTTLSGETLQDTLLEIAEHLQNQEHVTPSDWHEEMLITLSCHHSVRAGQGMSLEEMRHLLVDLEACENPLTCPHGRPTMVLLTPGQLDRQFGRVVS